MNDLVKTGTVNIDESDFALIQRIRDLWANNNDDLTVRVILDISSEKWKYLMKKLKEITQVDQDNHIAYQRYLAKQGRRSKELEELRTYATSLSEIGNAVKCFTLENQIDHEILSIGQKLGVLEGEVIRIEKTVKKENSVEVLFQNLEIDKKKEAERELKDLTQALMNDGIVIDGEFIETEDQGNKEQD